MTFFTVLDTILFRPLQLLFEVLYLVANKLLKDPGLSIIVLSLSMNFLVLPLYRKADALQEEEKQTEAKLRDGVAHIKKVFKGDEKMMILDTYYRQNHYKPTDVVKGALSLFLEIPFFIAAYRFLSGLSLLQGASLGPVADLSVPDGLIRLGSRCFNLLPVLMTGINLVSCVIFTKGAPLKTKLQLYGMAVFFLFFLYDSPSGLVFYWTLNNVFSLGKTLAYKLRRPKKNTGKAKKDIADNRKLFLAGTVFLTLLLGLRIPLSVIRSSAQEFVQLSHFESPLVFALSSFCLAAGTFLVWLNVFYGLSEKPGRKAYEYLVVIACGVTAVDFLFFGKNMPILDSTLTYTGDFPFGRRELLVNLGAVALTGGAMLLLTRLRPGWASRLLLIASLALAAMVPPDIASVNRQISEVRESAKELTDYPTIRLSKTGRNVVVVMLDRAMGEYLPCIFEEKPELKTAFDGFTVYQNTMSFGMFTNFGTPPIYGGYEYTPLEMNLRSDELLVDKHNEALRVMPELFSENGFDVTLIDPTYANYQWTSDLSVFGDIENCRAFHAVGVLEDDSNYASWRSANLRNFFLYSVMKTAPLLLQSKIYNHGLYWNSSTESASSQTALSMSVSTGIDSNYRRTVSLLDSLPSITFFEEDSRDRFLFMTSESTHQPCLLSEPDYEISDNIDNTAYDAAHADRFTVDGKTLSVTTADQMAHYHANMAALLRLSEWFDMLREAGVYDNTRIIIVSDHANGLHLDPEKVLDTGDDMEYLYPVLLVKDFGSTGLTWSDEFMTNADVPALAAEQVIEDPRNPFTGRSLSDSSAKEEPLYVLWSRHWDVTTNCGTQFMPDRWYRLTGKDMRLGSNWELVSDEAVLPEGFSDGE